MNHKLPRRGGDPFITAARRNEKDFSLLQSSVPLAESSKRVRGKKEEEYLTPGPKALKCGVLADVRAIESHFH